MNVEFNHNILGTSVPKPHFLLYNIKHLFLQPLKGSFIHIAMTILNSSHHGIKHLTPLHNILSSYSQIFLTYILFTFTFTEKTITLSPVRDKHIKIC